MPFGVSRSTMKDHSHHCFFTYSVKREPSIIFHVDIKHTLVRWFTLCGWRAGVLVATVWPGLVVCVLCPLLALAVGRRRVHASGLGAIRQVWRRATRSEDSVRRGV